MPSDRDPARCKNSHAVADRLADLPIGVVRAQFALVTAGAALIAIGMPTLDPWLTGLGGTAFVGAMALLGLMLWRAWRRALNVRHVVHLFAYGAAIGSCWWAGPWAR